jgi:hypothetical protein
VLAAQRRWLSVEVAELKHAADNVLDELNTVLAMVKPNPHVPKCSLKVP